MDLNKLAVDKKDAEDHKLAAVLAYFGILVAVTLLIAPDSKFARYHANQGLCLFVSYIVFSVITKVIKGIIGIVPVLGAVVNVFLGFVFALLSMMFLVFMILGIVNVIKGEAKPLPFIGGFQIIK